MAAIRTSSEDEIQAIDRLRKTLEKTNQHLSQIADSINDAFASVGVGALQNIEDKLRDIERAIEQQGS